MNGISLYVGNCVSCLCATLHSFFSFSYQLFELQKRDEEFLYNLKTVSLKIKTIIHLRINK
jgi:hypothetical protein